MADTLQISGAWSSTPLVSDPACGTPSITAPIAETLQLKERQLWEDLLTADPAVAVAFGGVANAHVVIVKTNKKVRLRLTSADGSAQAVPVDGFLQLITKTVPYTAIDVTRVAGVDTKVKVFLGEKA